MNEITYSVALLAGIASFLSPCVLPIVPGFLAYLAGGSTEQKQPSRRDIFINSVFFVLGFSLVFAALGVLLNTLLSNIAYDAQIWLSRIGGIIIILFGLYLTKVIRLSWLNKEYKIKVRRTKFKYVTSFLFGLAFAVGWTPCVGAALGAILALSATQPSIAFYLLLTYALGLGLPFLLIGIFTAQATKLIAKIGPALKYVNFIFGLVLIVLGVLVFTQNLARFANLGFLNNILY